jgi:hypothetical protein
VRCVALFTFHERVSCRGCVRYVRWKVPGSGRGG